jgi:NADP-dependent 3-hydroxy acid dehydrogenase YdfG
MNSRIAIVAGASAGIGQATAIRPAHHFTGLVLVFTYKSGK